MICEVGNIIFTKSFEEVTEERNGIVQTSLGAALFFDESFAEDFLTIESKCDGVYWCLNNRSNMHFWIHPSCIKGVAKYIETFD